MWSPRGAKAGRLARSAHSRAVPIKIVREEAGVRFETETPLPERPPEWKRSGERAPPEQAGGVVPPIAGAVVPGDDQTEHEGKGVLPAVQVTSGEQLLHRVADPGAEQRPFTDGPIQLAQDGEGGEVGGEEHGEAPDGAREVTAQRRGRTTLEREPGVGDLTRCVVRRVYGSVRPPGSDDPGRLGGRHAILYGIHHLLETPQGRRTSAGRTGKDRGRGGGCLDVREAPATEQLGRETWRSRPVVWTPPT